MTRIVWTVLRKLRTFARQPFSRKRLALEAVAELGRARLLILRRGQLGASREWGRRLDIVAERAVPLDHWRTEPREVRWAIEAVSPWMPWDTTCLVQALAAGRMLSRRGVPWDLRIGLCRDETRQLLAHAWLRSGRYVVTGRGGAGRFTEIITYGPRTTSSGPAVGS
jgi:transglutaminase superfamily protein